MIVRAGERDRRLDERIDDLFALGSLWFRDFDNLAPLVRAAIRADVVGLLLLTAVRAGHELR